MKKELSVTSTQVVVASRSRPDAAAVPKVKLYEDANGGIWKFTPIALDSNQVAKLRLQHGAGEINLEIRPMSEVLPVEDDREAEMRWLHDNLNNIAALYPGEWIAIDGPALVAHAADLPSLLKKAAEAGHPNPFITAVPSEPTISLHV